MSSEETEAVVQGKKYRRVEEEKLIKEGKKTLDIISRGKWEEE